MLKVKSISKRNPQDPDAPNKFYASPVYDGRVDLNELAWFAAKQSTVSRADCYAVLISLVDLVTYQLSQGKIVQLGELGNFRLSVSSEGRDLEEELTTSAIKRAKVLFSPGAEIRAMLKSATFKKVD